MRRLGLTTAVFVLAACPADDPMTTATPDTTTTTTDATGSTGTPGSTGTTDDDPTSTTGTTDDPTGTSTSPTTGTTTGGNVCDGVDVPAIDEGMCAVVATDYQPRVNNSMDDMWPACVSDMGPYTLVDKPPSTIARTVAYEDISALLWLKKDPTAADFTAARDAYVLPEGIESRVVRREDLHYPPIPMNEWDPQVDADKQCTVPALATKYRERCIGPSTMQPLIDAAFADGQAGNGDPNVLAETIHGGLFWFFYLSVHKEANTCATVAAKDCDSSWAYYTGGQPIEAGIGISREIKAESQNTHERIHDGIMAARCWRDIAQDGDMYPLLDTLPQDQKDLFDRGWEQLDQALHRGFVVVIRDYMERYIDASCAGTDTAPAWAFLKIAGPAMQREANERDAAQGTVLADLWAADAPGPDEVAAAITALDAIFPCP
jgi:hypothetical protein